MRELKCYNHPTEEAVAVCKSCGKGMCKDCNINIEKISYCKSCIESGKVRPWVSFQEQTVPQRQEISSLAQVNQPHSLMEIKRPTWLTLISVFWIFYGLYNFFVGLTNASTDAQLINQYGPSLNDFGQGVIVIDGFIGVIILILGVVQLITVYGFLTGKSWSYKSGIATPVIAIITSLSQYILWSLAEIPGASLSLPITNTVVAIILFWYLRKGHVQAWLFKDIGFTGSKSQFITKCDTCHAEILQKNPEICPYCGSKNFVTETWRS